MVLSDGTIVMINDPRTFHAKKSEFIGAGPQQMQVFLDFERCMGSFKARDGTGAASMGTAEVLETSGVLQPSAVQKLQELAEEYGSQGDDDAVFEEYGDACRATIASIGGLHISHIAPATAASLPMLALRDGWRDSLHTLSTNNIPTYIFSSGYGDIVEQAIIQAGQLPNNVLPQNLRIISNFFRTAPDGTVRAFSSPVIHERNKNADTAAKFMGMSLPERSYALICGTHEDDVLMAQGAPGLKENISVGYLEVGEDLAARLPSFLNRFDVVVLGDGSFQFIQTLLRDLLHLPLQQERGGKKWVDNLRGAFLGQTQ